MAQFTPLYMRDISADINNRLPFEGAFALEAITKLSDNMLQTLSSREKKHLQSITNLRRRQEYATSRHTLKVLAQSMGLGALTIHKDELGQPFGGIGDEKYFVSIAHTNSTVFCGLTANNAIGLDLEPTDREVPDKLRTRILHPDEQAFIQSMKLIRLWTIKEAYIKLRGQGLRLNMNQVRVLEDEGQFWAEINNDKRAKICSFQAEHNWLAIAHY